MRPGGATAESAGPGGACCCGAAAAAFAVFAAAVALVAAVGTAATRLAVEPVTGRAAALASAPAWPTASALARPADACQRALLRSGFSALRLPLLPVAYGPGRDLPGCWQHPPSNRSQHGTA